MSLARCLWFVLFLLVSSCNQEKVNESLFTLLSSKRTNITFKNLLRETEAFNVLKYGYFYNGGGVAIGDINNDGLPDIYFTGNMVASHLYLNQGNWKFKEIAEEAGVAAAGLWNTGVTMADVNNDGYLDIYVCRSAAANPYNRKNRLFINNRDLTFTEHAETFGLADTGYSTQAAFFDYDKDGDLDMYLLNHSVQEYAGFGSITASLKNRHNPNHGDKLYRNDEVLFTDVSRGAGIKSNVLGFGLGLAISDLNADGWPDIYVSNDYNEQDYLYINNGNGTFSDHLKNYLGHVSMFSMGSDIADINNDGFYDIMTLDMLPEGNYRQKLVSGPDNYDKYQRLVSSGFYNQTMRNMLQLNLQGRGFSEIGQLSGVSNTDWSWASLFADFDNDGNKDLFVSNGYQRDYTNMDFLNFMVNETLKQNQGGETMATMDAIQQMPSILVPNYIYQNQGNLTFKNKTKEWGLDQVSLSNGAAYADLDMDGDLDMVVNNINEPAFIYRNNARQKNQNNFLQISLKGDSANTQGVGAKVILQCGEQTFSQEAMPTRGFQSSVDNVLTFGIGKHQLVDLVRVQWPDGRVQELNNQQVNQLINIFQEHAQSPDSLSSQPKPTLFTLLDPQVFYHKENQFVDFKREQLLTHKLSTQGPRIAVADINGDGLDDVYIGGAKESPGKILKQGANGAFMETFSSDSAYEDTAALFFDADQDGDKDLYIVSGGADFESDDKRLQDRLLVNNGNGEFALTKDALPAMNTSGSSVSAADFDGDGDQDLFVGGRMIPGNYPQAPRSYLLENNGLGSFKDITEEVNPDLMYPGMVTDVLWSDFNGDAEPDLILVGEWMPIKLFQNMGGGALQEVTQEAGTAETFGWWNRLVGEDMDEDGDVDYVIGNFGWNSQIKGSAAEPVTLYVHDFDNNGRTDPILCYYVQGESYPALSKDDLEKQLPLIKKKYVTYADYAGKKIQDIFTEAELQEARVLKATTLATSYLENMGNGRFELHALPLEAQISPTFGILLDDFDADGVKDILLGGNFFGTRVKFGIYDANHGVLLKGKGNGGYSQISNNQTGLWLEGEVRDLVEVKSMNHRFLLCARNNDYSLLFQRNPN